MYSLEKITLLSLHFIIGVFYFIPALNIYFILSSIKSASESEDECDYFLFKARRWTQEITLETGGWSVWSRSQEQQIWLVYWLEVISTLLNIMSHFFIRQFFKMVILCLDYVLDWTGLLIRSLMISVELWSTFGQKEAKKIGIPAKVTICNKVLRISLFSRC